MKSIESRSENSSESVGGNGLGADWSVLENYRKDQRARVDRLKGDIRDSWDNYNKYNYEKIDIKPSTVRMLGRIAMDAIGFTTRASEQRRDREAMSVAVDEIKAEDEEKEVQSMLASEQGNLSKGVQQIMYDEKRARELARAEQEKFENEFFREMDWRREERKNYFHNQRVQEIVEKELNNKLTGVDTLEEAVRAGDSKVEKRTLDYNDKNVEVYDLNGFPFAMLSHDIGYRIGNDTTMDQKNFGYKTAKKLTDDPSLWNKNRWEAEKSDGFGRTVNDVGVAKNATGDVISTSYINSEKNIDTRSCSGVCYGFSHLNGDSIMDVFNNDGQTSNANGKRLIGLDRSKVDVIDKLENNRPYGPYNEITLRRYDESGRPRTPDYIITENGYISRDSLKHAAYWDIPIVNINRSAYLKEPNGSAEE